MSKGKRKSGTPARVMKANPDPNGNREARRAAKRAGMKPRGRLAELAARMRRTDDDGGAA